jgi:hypothetical protein
MGIGYYRVDVLLSLSSARVLAVGREARQTSALTPVLKMEIRIFPILLLHSSICI